MLGVDQPHNQYFRLHWTYSGKARNPRDARAMRKACAWRSCWLSRIRSKSASSPIPICLEEQGHQVLSAGTAAGALAILHRSPAVDLLFTDLDLKGDVHAGIELAKAAVKLHPQLRP